MVDLIAIKSAVDGLKAARDIAKTAIGLRDAAMLQSKVIEMNDAIMAAQSSALDAQSEQFALIERISELEKEVARFETWETEKQRYELKAVDRGSFAYVPKPGMQGSEPPHWLCANCYSNGHKSFLQFKGRIQTPGGGRSDQDRYDCGFCKSELLVGYTKSPSKN
jgi:hypothetical protein